MKRPELIRLLLEQTPKVGFNYAPLEHLLLYRSEKDIKDITIMYDPCIVIVAQRRKVGYIGDETFYYDPGNYLVVPTVLPIECSAEGSPEKPFLALSIPLTHPILTELVSQMEAPRSEAWTNRPAIYVEAMTEQLSDAAVRLLRSFQSPMEAKLLGPQIIREIFFRVLQGPKAGLIFDLFSKQNKNIRIAKSLRYIHENIATKLDIEALALQGGMSQSLFFAQFKAYTSSSPTQYIKKVRLNRARDLITFEGMTVSTAAFQVGYASVSQFSREFKRYFGYNAKESASHYPVPN